MNLFGIGITELVFFFLIIIILFGPKDIIKFSQSAGKFIRNFKDSEIFSGIKRINEEIRKFPDYLVEESNLKDEINEFKDTVKEINLDSTPIKNSEQSLVNNTQSNNGESPSLKDN